MAIRPNGTPDIGVQLVLLEVPLGPIDPAWGPIGVSLGLPGVQICLSGVRLAPPWGPIGFPLYLHVNFILGKSSIALPSLH